MVSPFATELQSIHYRKIVDLSHPLHPGIPRWVGDPAVTFRSVAKLDREGYNLRRVSLGEHTGTHMNAPSSFFANASGIDAYPPECLVVPACVINLCAQAVMDPDVVLTPQDVLAWEQDYGKVPEGAVVLLFTGWQFRWHDSQTFLNLDAAGMPHFPGFGKDVTQFLLAERSIAGVGIDTHGVDSGKDTTYATNRQVLAQQGIVLECLNNLDQLPPLGTTLTIGILRLKKGSGSPASVMAFVP